MAETEKKYNIGEPQPQTYTDYKDGSTVEYTKYSFDGNPSSNGNSGSFCIKYPEGYDPNNPNPNTKIVFISWGAETSDADSGYLFDMANDGTLNGAEDCIFITPSSNAPEDIQAIVDNFDKLNLENNSVSAITFSQPSKTPVISEYIDVMKDNPANYQPMVIMGCQEGLLTASDDLIQRMKDKNAALFVVSDGEQLLGLPNYVSNLRTINDAGVPVVILKIENGEDYGHGIVDSLAMKSGLTANLVAGIPVDIKAFEEKYNVTICAVDANGQEVDINQYLGGDPYENIILKYKKSDMIAAYEVLENIQSIPYNITGSPNFSNSLVQMNMPALFSAVNNVRSQMKTASNFSSFKVPQFASSSNILGDIVSCMENYFSAVGDLYTKLEQETTATLSVKTTVEDQDRFLEQKVEEVEKPEEENKQNPESNNVGASNPPYVEPETLTKPVTPATPEKSENKPTPTPTPGNSNQNNEGPVTPVTPITPEPPVTPEKPSEEGKTDIDSQIEDNPSEGKVTYKYKDGHKLLIEYEENTVKSMKYQYAYSSVEEASTNLSAVQTKYENQDFVKNIEVKEKNIEVEFKDIAFNTKSLEEIKGIYFVE